MISWELHQPNFGPISNLCNFANSKLQMCRNHCYAASQLWVCRVNAQCGKSRIFLLPRFYVKSLLQPFLQFGGFGIFIFVRFNKHWSVAKIQSLRNCWNSRFWATNTDFTYVMLYFNARVYPCPQSDFRVPKVTRHVKLE